MGLFKFIGLMSGLPIRPTTGRERARKYQRQANDLLEEQLYAIQNLAPQQQIQQPSPFPNDTRPRGTCPACLEMMLVGATTCPHCHTTGIAWPTGTSISTSAPTWQQTVDTIRVCSRCAGKVYLNNHNQVCCSRCKAQFSAREYPHLSAP